MSRDESGVAEPLEETVLMLSSLLLCLDVGLVGTGLAPVALAACACSWRSEGEEVIVRMEEQIQEIQETERA